MDIDPLKIPERRNEEDLNLVKSWTDEDDCTKMVSIIKHKVTTEKEEKEVMFLVDYLLEDDESDSASIRVQMDKEGGLWISSENLKLDAPVLMGRYMVEHDLNINSSKEFKEAWCALKKHMERKSLKKTKKAAHKPVPKAVMIPVSPEKTCDHCNDWTHHKVEENADFFGIRGDLQGAKCSACNGNMHDDAKCKPSSRNPGYTCSGRETHHCMSCYCGNCYRKKVLLDDSNSSSRRPKRRKL